MARGRINGSQVHTLVPLVLAPGSEPLHAAWIGRAAEVTVRRLEDGVEHALATDVLAPMLLPDLPAGVQIGAEHRGGEETDVWVANLPAEVARPFRACLCSVARRLNTSQSRALEAMFDHSIASWWVLTPRARSAGLRDAARSLRLRRSRRAHSCADQQRTR